MYKRQIQSSWNIVNRKGMQIMGSSRDISNYHGCIQSRGYLTDTSAYTGNHSAAGKGRRFHITVCSGSRTYGSAVGETSACRDHKSINTGSGQDNIGGAGLCGIKDCGIASKNTFC